MNQHYKLAWRILLSVTVLALLLLGIAACSGEESQSEELSSTAIVEPGTYVLSAKHSGMVLDLPSSNTQAGIQLWQYPRNNSAAQQWKVEVVENTRTKITSVVNGYALNAPLTPVNGAKVSLQPYTSNLNSKLWVLVDVGGGYYEIVNRASRGRLTVSGASTAQGALLTTWARTNTDNQKWKLEKVDGATSNYQQNLAMITGATIRNRNLDSSSFRNTPTANLPTGSNSPLLGPRLDYITGDDGQITEYGRIPGLPGGNPEPGFPIKGAGTFRTSCEFSHFAYDDPLVHPNKPGAAHLHMFWGNTDVNAYSTYETLRDSGSSTCNGMELNRTGYWAPAMFDAKGNVRIPERVIVYYKGYGLAQGNAEVYPPRAAMVIDDKVHRTPDGQGGIPEANFLCTDQSRGGRNSGSATIPVCGNYEFNRKRVLEMHVKFPNCWNGLDPSKPENWLLASTGGWFFSNCVADGNKTFPNIEYIIAYPLEPGETTTGWYLSSDVNPTTRTRTKTGGSTIHADWWGAWNPTINKQWIDNCVNSKTDVNGDGTDDRDHGCGFGYLSDGGPEVQLDANGNPVKDSSGNPIAVPPIPGPALKYRQQYTGPFKVAASTLYRELCPGGTSITSATAAAYCKPPAANLMSSPGSTDHAHH